MHVATEKIVGALEKAGYLVERRGTLPDTVAGLTDDSRRVARGGMFAAIKGTALDGHDFLEAAVQAGAAAAIVEHAVPTPVPTLVVREGRRAAAVAAAAAYDWPARSLQLIGITGTNGKTTTANMLRHILADGAGEGSASIGTLGILVGTAAKAPPLDGGGGLTTPGPIELQRVFRALVDQGIHRVAMEVSSHALDQRRVEGVRFDVAT